MNRFFPSAILLIGFTSALPVNAADPSSGSVTVTRTDLTGVGREDAVCRRDPSDVIKVGDLYYVWYSRGPVKTGYNATVWYATSPDGVDWTEKGEAITKGGAGSWDEASVFTSNILVAEGRFWLFYTGISKHPKVKPDSKIGIAVADSPDGPWGRSPNNPVLRNSDNEADFDSHLVDDFCLMERDGKYWFYYKGRQLGKSPAETQMGLAIADRPDEIINTVQYAEDGIHFTKTHDVGNGPRAGGACRPEAGTEHGEGDPIRWGIEIGEPNEKGGLPFLRRYDLKWPKP